MLNEVEAIVKNIVAQPLAKTEADLKSLAAVHKDSALPLLATVIVSSFTQYERYAEAQALLSQAEKLVKTNSTDPELIFEEAFAVAIRKQFDLITIRGNDIEIRVTPQGQTASQNALVQLKAAAGRNPGSHLAQVITATLYAFSRNGASTPKNYADGIADLTRFKTQGTSQDLAAYFLMYAHRRGSNFKASITVGQELEQREPNSSLIKKAIGSNYFFENDLPNAERFYKQALALSPNDPSVHLGLAQINEKKGDAAAARQFAASAKQLDSAGRLSIYTSKIK
jgi:tetratricopeptide (TPR) repeat protein